MTANFCQSEINSVQYCHAAKHIKLNTGKTKNFPVVLLVCKT
jgi:hypothetical protein